MKSLLATFSILLFLQSACFYHSTRAFSDITPPSTSNNNKSTWKVFVDLQCPYARKCWQRLPDIKDRFQKNYDFSIHLTSLAFHPQAFVGQQAAYLIGITLGPKSKLDFINACFEHQDLYTNDSLGDCRKSDVDNVFADIAQKAGLFDEAFSRETFLSSLHGWDTIIKPAYAEHKVALGYGVFGTPKHVIDEKLVPDTESSWGPDEWQSHLEKIQLAA